jgi:hypothetical protein
MHLNLNKLNSEGKADIIEPSQEDLFSIEANNSHEDEPKLDVEMGLSGNLVTVETMEEEEIVVTPVIGVENLEDEIPLVSAPGPQGLPTEPKEKEPNTVYVLTPTKVHAYLHGKCSESVDTLIHLLSQATEDTEAYISYCYPMIDIYDALELVGVIGATKAKVTLDIIGVSSVVDLLLLTNEDCTINLAQNLIVTGIKEVSFGSLYNLEESLIATKNYQELVYTSLKENGILSDDEIDTLSAKGGMLYLDKTIVDSRSKKTTPVEELSE